MNESYVYLLINSNKYLQVVAARFVIAQVDLQRAASIRLAIGVSFSSPEPPEKTTTATSGSGALRR